MNNSYRLVWSLAAQCYVPAPETAKSRGKSGGRRAMGLVMVTALATHNGLVHADNLIVPTGQTATAVQVIGNKSNITTGTIKGNTALNAFSKFEVDAGRTVNLMVPNSAKTLVNLVYDAPVRVNGILNSIQNGAVGGQVLFADPFGMIVGASGVLNVGSLTVTTPTTQAMSRIFDAGGQIDADALSRVTSGLAQQASTGLIRIDGQINALEKILLQGSQVDVSGRLNAGADAAHQAAFVAAVNTSGLQPSTGLVEANGVIEIVGDASATLSGALSVSSATGTGGTASIMASKVNLTSTATVDASGTTGGGQIKVGTVTDAAGVTTHALQTEVQAGATLRADALEDGKGGTVEVWGDERNRFGGSISALGGAKGGDGGWVEVSSHNGLQLTGGVDTSAPKGHVGTLLLDPDDLNIVETLPAGTPTGGSVMTTAAIKTLVANNAVEIKADTKNVTLGGSDGSSAILDFSNSTAITFTAKDSVVFNKGSKLKTGGGNVSIDAKTVKLNTGSEIDAGSGKVEIKAEAKTTVDSPDLELIKDIPANTTDFLANTKDGNADGRIDVYGTITGKTISLTATATATSGSGSEIANLLGNLSSSGTGLAGLKWASRTVHAKAIITVGSDANLTADDELKISSSANQSVKLDLRVGDNLNSTFSVIAVHGKVEGGASSQVESGAHLTSKNGNLIVEATNDSTLSVAAKSLSYKTGLIANVAYGESDLKTDAVIKSGAVIKADKGGLTVSASSTSDNHVVADGTAADKGAVGGAAAISKLHETSTATLGADLQQAAQDVKVSATTKVNQNFTKASTEVGTSFVTGTFNPALLIPLAGGSDGFTSAISLLSNSKDGVLAKPKVDAAAGTQTSTGKFGSALSFVDADFEADASIGKDAKVGSTGGSVNVNATVEDHQLHNIAQSLINSQTSAQKGTSTDPAAKTAISAALALAFLKHTATATVGSNAEVTGTSINVTSAVQQPLDITWAKWEGLSTITNKLSTKLGLPEEVLTTYANAIGVATDVALSGSVNWFEESNKSQAWVGQSAKLNLITAAVPVVSPANTSTSPAAKINVEASNQVETVDMAGNINSYLISGAGGGPDTTSVGGAFNSVHYTNTTTAGIDDGATVVAGDGSLTVSAHSDDTAYVVTPSTGLGASIGASGAGAYTYIQNITRAALSNRATINSGALEVKAAEDSEVWTATGAVNGASATSVGLSVAVNDIHTQTDALIGDVSEVRPDSMSPAVNLSTVGSIAATSVKVDATTDGQLYALSVAGAAASNSAPAGDKSDEKAADDKTKDVKDKSSESSTNASKALAAAKWVFLRRADPNAPKPGVVPIDQPTSSLAVSGSSSVSDAKMGTTAKIVGGTATLTGALDVKAVNNTKLVAASGGAALVSAGAPTSTESKALAGALAINLEANNTTADTDGSTFTGANAMRIQALASGQHVAAGVGLSGATGNGNSNTLAGSASLTMTTNTIEAYAKGSTFDGSNAGSPDLTVLAHDKTEMVLGGLTVSKSAGNGVGAAISFADIGNTVSAHLDDTSATDLGELSVLALSPNRVILGALEGAVSDSKTAAGISLAATHVHNITNASVANGAADTLSAKAVQVVASDSPNKEGLIYKLTEPSSPGSSPSVLGDLGVAPPEGSSIISVAGSLDVGKTALGVAMSYNEIENHTTATLHGKVTLRLADSTLKVMASDWSSIVSVAAGVSVAKDKDKAGAAGAGSVSVNEVKNDTEAVLGDASIDFAPGVTAQAIAPTIQVNATSGSSVWSAAGSVNYAGKGGSSAGAALAYNDSGSTTKATLTHVTAVGGAISVQSVDASQMHAMAVAIGASAEGNTLDGSFAWNASKGSVNAKVEDSDLTASQLSVKAGDVDGSTTSINALAGGAALNLGSTGSTASAMGAAIAVNELNQTHEATVSRSQLHVSGDVDIKAGTHATLRTLAMGFASAKDKLSAGLSASANSIKNTTRAQLVGGGLNNDSTQAADQANDKTASLTLQATDSSEIDAMAGAFAGSKGGNALGVALAVNDIGNTVDAHVQGGTVRAKGVQVQADSTETTQSIAVSLGVLAGADKEPKKPGLAFGGSMAVSLSGSTTTATIDQGADVLARQNVGVMASNTNKISTFAGGVGLSKSSSDLGIGAAVSINKLKDTTQAVIGGGADPKTRVTAKAESENDSDKLAVNSGQLGAASSFNIPEDDHSSLEASVVLLENQSKLTGVAVNASSLQTLRSAAVSLGASGGVSGAGTNTTNIVANTTTAKIDSAQINQEQSAGAPKGKVDVNASSHSASSSLVGSLATSGKAALGLAVDTETMGGVTTAAVVDSTVNTPDQLKITANSSAHVAALAAGMADSGSVAVVGTGLVAKVNGLTSASLVGGKATVGSLDVSAKSDQTTRLIGGSLGAGAQVGFGAAFAVIDAHQKTLAYIGDAYAPAAPKDTIVNTEGDVRVTADTTVSNKIVVASAGLSGEVGLALTAGVVLDANTTEATVASLNAKPGSTAGLTMGALKVKAIETDTDTQYAGALGAGGTVGVAATAAVTVAQAHVSAQIRDSNIKSHSVEVLADNFQDISHLAVSGAAGFYAGIGGTVSLIQLGGLDENHSGGSAEAIAMVNSLSSTDNSADAGNFLTQDDRANNKADVSTAQLSGGNKNSAQANVRHSTVTTVAGAAAGVGDVTIKAQSLSKLNNTAGALGVGLAGVGGAVTVTSASNLVEASVDGATTLDLAGKLGVTASSGSHNATDTIESHAYAGAAGGAALGAAVGFSTLDNVVTAQAVGTITNSKEVRIEANDTTSINTEADSAAIGASAAVGAAVVDASKSGKVTASVAPVSLKTAGLLSVDANSAGRVKALTRAGAAGVGGALSGNYAHAKDGVKVTAEIGDGAVVAAATTTVHASRTPEVSAHTFSVGVSGGVQAGVSDSVAEVKGDTLAKVGDGAKFTTLSTDALPVSLKVSAQNLVSASGHTAKADAEADGGGLLLGANGAMATATNNATVKAIVGNDVTLPMGDVLIEALASSVQSATASGISIGGVAGIGADLATATSEVTTLAQLGSGARNNTHRDVLLDGAGHVIGAIDVIDPVGSLSINAKGTDANNAKAIAGAGGIVAGAAAFASTSTKGSMTAEVADATSAPGNTLYLGALQISSEHTANFFSQSDAIQASIAGGSGADARGAVSFNVKAGIGDQAKIDTTDVVIQALNHVHESGSGYNADGVSGGVVAGAGMSSSNNIGNTTTASIGKDASVVVSGDPMSSTHGNFTMEASNTVDASDKAHVDSGGLFAGLTSTSTTDVTSNNEVKVGKNAQLSSVGNLELGTSSQQNVSNEAYGHGYGLAGGAGGHATTNLTANQNVDIGSGAHLYSWGDMDIATGRSPGAARDNTLFANANNQVYFDGAFNGTDPHGQAYTHNNGHITVAAGAELSSVRDIALVTRAGVSSAHAQGDGHYTLLGIPLSNHNSDSGSDGELKLTFDGKAEAGVRHEASLHIIPDGMNVVFDANQVVATRISDYNPIARLTEQAQYLCSVSNDCVDGDPKKSNDETIKTLNFLIETVTARGQTGVVGAVEVGNVLASAGNITVATGKFEGQGDMTAWGGPKITLTNDSDRFLLVNTILIPNVLGGHITFSGPGQPDAVFLASYVHEKQKNVAGSVTIENSFDSARPGESRKPPGIFLLDAIENVGGALSIANRSGDLAQFGSVSVNGSGILVPNGAYVVNSPDAGYFLNGDPQGQFVSADESVFGGRFCFLGCKYITMGGNTPGVFLPGGANANSTLLESSLGSKSDGGYGAPGSADEAVTYVANYFASTDPRYKDAYALATNSQELGKVLAGGVGPTPWDSKADSSAQIIASQQTGVMFFYTASAKEKQSSVDYIKTYGPDTGFYSYDYGVFFPFRHYYPSIGIRPLSNRIATHSPGRPAPTSNVTKVGTAAVINAQYININGTIKVGLDEKFSVEITDTPSNIPVFANGQIVNKSWLECVQDATCAGPLTQGKAVNGLVKYPDAGVAFVNAGDKVVDVYYDLDAKTFVIPSIKGGGGGSVSLHGSIINTNASGSSIEVSNGYAQMTVDNQTSAALRTGSIDLGSGTLGIVKITDTLKKDQAGNSLTTWYVDPLGEGSGVYSSYTAKDYIGLPKASALNNYQPEAGSRYFWNYDATLTRDVNVVDGNLYNLTSGSWRWKPVSGMATLGGVWAVSNGVLNDTKLSEVSFAEDISGAITSKVSRKVSYESGNGVAMEWNWEWVTGVSITAKNSVKADYPINISFTGGNTAGQVKVDSLGSVVIGGKIQNTSGLTQISATGNQATITASAGGLINTQSLALNANAGIGSSTNPLAVNLVNPEVLSSAPHKVTATSQNGDIGLAFSGGDATLVNISAGTSHDVWLSGSASLLNDDPNGTNAAVTARNVNLTSERGGIGSLGNPLRVHTISSTNAETGVASGGILNATAQGDVALVQVADDLYVGRVESMQGDVALTAKDGRLLDGLNRESSDQSEAQKALWTKLELQAPSQDKPSNAAVTAFQNTVDSAHAGYWALLSQGTLDAEGHLVLSAAGVKALQSQAEAAQAATQQALQSSAPLDAGAVQLYAQGRLQQYKEVLQKAGVSKADTSANRNKDLAPALIARYQALTNKGVNLVDGQFALPDAEVARWQSDADQALKRTATASEVKAYAAAQVAELTAQHIDKAFSFTASEAQRTAMTAGQYWTTKNLLYQINVQALKPASVSDISDASLNVKGRKVMLSSLQDSSASIGIGSLANAVKFTADDFAKGLSNEQKSALATATSNGDVIEQVLRNPVTKDVCPEISKDCSLDSFGIKQTKPLQLSVSESLTASTEGLGGSIYLAAQGNLPIASVTTEGGEVSITANKDLTNALASTSAVNFASTGSKAMSLKLISGSAGSIGLQGGAFILGSNVQIETANSGLDIYLEAPSGDLVFNTLAAVNGIYLNTDGNVISNNKTGSSLRAQSLTLNVTGSVFQGSENHALLTELAGPLKGAVAGNLSLSNKDTLLLDGLDVGGTADLKAQDGDLKVNHVSGPDLQLAAVKGKITGVGNGRSENILSTGVVKLNGGHNTNSSTGSGIGESEIKRLIVAAQTLDAGTGAGDVFIHFVDAPAGTVFGMAPALLLTGQTGSNLDVSADTSFTAASISSAKGLGSGTSADTGADVKLSTSGSAIMTLGNLSVGRDLVINTFDGGFTTLPNSSVSITRDLKLTMTGSGTMTDSASNGGQSGATIRAGRDIVMNAAAFDLGNYEASGGMNLVARVGDLHFANLTALGGDVVADVAGTIVGASTASGKSAIHAQHDIKLTAQALELIHTKIEAQTGDTALTATDGDIDFSNLTAGQNVAIKASGNVTGGAGSSLASSGPSNTVQAGKRLSIDQLATAGSTELTAGTDAKIGTVAVDSATAASKLKVTAVGQIDITSGEVFGDLETSSAGLNLSSMQVHGGTSLATTGAGATGQLLVRDLTVDQHLAATSAASMTLAKASAAGDVRLNAGTAMQLDSVLSGRDLTVAADTVGFDQLSAGRDASMIASGSITGASGASAIHVQHDIKLTAQALQLSHSELEAQAGDMALTATDGDINFSKLTAGQNLAIKASGKVSGGAGSSLASSGPLNTVQAAKMLSIDQLATAGTTELTAGTDAKIGTVAVGSATAASTLKATAAGKLDITSGDVWGDLKTSSAGLDLGTVHVHGGASLATIGVGAAGQLLVRDVNVDQDLIATSAGTISLVKISSAGDVILEATSDINGGIVAAGQDLSLKSGGAVRADSLSAGGKLTISAAMGTDVKSLSGAELVVSSAGAVRMTNVKLNQALSVEAATMDLGVQQSGENGLVLSLSGYQGGVAERVTLRADAAAGLLFPTLSARVATIETNSSLNHVVNGYITNTLSLKSPLGTMWMDNTRPTSVFGVDIQLYQPTFAFSLKQDGRFFTTNAYVTQYGQTALTSSTNYQESRDAGTVAVYARSAAVDAERYASANRRTEPSTPLIAMRSATLPVAVFSAQDDGEVMVNWGLLTTQGAPANVLIEKGAD